MGIHGEWPHPNLIVKGQVRAEQPRPPLAEAIMERVDHVAGDVAEVAVQAFGRANVVGHYIGHEVLSLLRR